MKQFIRLLIRWPYGCLILFVAGCNQTNNYNSFILTKQDSLAHREMVKRAYNKIDSVKNFIQNGDMITRTGNDFTSESLRNLNQRDKTFSHCGIASIEHDTIFVYHALGGDFNPDQKIRRDPIDIFAEPYTNKGIGIFRFELSDSSRQLFVSDARELYDNGVMFDMDFDLKTDDRMYCAEFLYKCFVKASNGKLSFNHSHLKQFEYIGVDDLFLNPLCKMKAKIVYK